MRGILFKVGLCFFFEGSREICGVFIEGKDRV